MNKYVGQKYRVLYNQEEVFKQGDIATLVEICTFNVSLYEHESGETYYLKDIDSTSPDVELMETSKIKKYVGQMYRVIRDDDDNFKPGEIVKLVEILSDVSLYENAEGRRELLFDIDCESFTPEVELFEKYVGQRYKVIRNDENTFEIGEIVNLVSIHSDDISLYENDSGRTEYLYDIDCVEEHTEVELVDPSEVWVVNVSSRADGSSTEVYMTFDEAVKNARREFERRYELLKGSMDVSNHIIVISPDLRNYDVYMKDNHDTGFRIEIVPSRLYA